jgi:hypothetical protein
VIPVPEGHRSILAAGVARAGGPAFPLIFLSLTNTESAPSFTQKRAFVVIVANSSPYSVCWLTFNKMPTLASITNKLDPHKK